MQPWDTHEWSRGLGQTVGVGGKFLLHRSCVVCGRNFMVDLDSDDLFAVNVAALQFQRLAREVSERWRRENCPGKRLPNDETDKVTRVQLPFTRASHSGT
jgi:hypothetical protein